MRASKVTISRPSSCATLQIAINSTLLYCVRMHVIAWPRLKAFYERHPAAEPPLRAWFKTISAAQFKSFAELKQAFGTVDKVAEWHVFDIGGNKYRLICYLRFDWQRCYVRHVLTHTKYDKGAWKQ